MGRVKVRHNIAKRDEETEILDYFTKVYESVIGNEKEPRSCIRFCR